MKDNFQQFDANEKSKNFSSLSLNDRERVFLELIANIIVRISLEEYYKNREVCNNDEEKFE